MKTKLVITAAGLLMTTGWILAQNGPGSGPGNGPGTPPITNSYSNYYSYSNSVSQSNAYKNVWGTNHVALTNTPVAWSNQFSHSYAGKSAAGGGGQVQNRFGKPELPTDVQTIVQQFQQDRTRLMEQLKNASDEQRQLILKEMEQLRLQLREQVSKIREDARQQAEQMRNRFGNNRDALLQQGVDKTGTGRDR